MEETTVIVGEITALEQQGKDVFVCGEITALEQQGKDVFVITAVASAPHSAADLSKALQGGAITWRDLDIEDPMVRLRVAMLDKMRPLPRVELEIVEVDADAGGASKVDSDYFQSYEDIGTHELMLRDHPRMEAYRDAIMRNSEAMQGKTVLDVGCGTGILSMMAAKAGAKVVYAVEASSMAAHAKHLVEYNGLSDIVTVLHARMEDVDLPEKVDVIISEWMGFYLVHESMLNSVLDARDRWMKEGGLMLPSHATIYACPVSMDQYRQDKVDFWADVCGLDLTPFGQKVAAASSAPLVQLIEGGQLLAEPAVVASFDCGNVTVADLASIANTLSFKISSPGRLAGIALWFDCLFDVRSSSSTSTDTSTSPDSSSSRKRPRNAVDATNGKAACVGATAGHTNEEDDGGGGSVTVGTGVGEQVVLSTSPKSGATHWKQTIVMLGVYASVEVGEEMDVAVAIRQDAQNPRVYSISINT